MVSGKEIVELLKSNPYFLDRNFSPSSLYINTLDISFLTNKEKEIGDMDSYLDKIDELSFREFIETNNPYIKDIIEYGQAKFEGEVALLTYDRETRKELYLRSDRVLFVKGEKVIRSQPKLDVNLGAILEDYLKMLYVELGGAIKNNTIEIFEYGQILPYLSDFTIGETDSIYAKKGERIIIFPLKVEVENRLGRTKVLEFTINSGVIRFELRKYFDHYSFEQDFMTPFEGVGDTLSSYMPLVVVERYSKYWRFLRKTIEAITDTLTILLGIGFKVVVSPYGEFTFTQNEDFYDEENTLETLQNRLEETFSQIF